jgi:hypothetical protein
MSSLNETASTTFIAVTSATSPFETALACRDTKTDAHLSCFSYTPAAAH